jgi:hypothetical protein
VSESNVSRTGTDVPPRILPPTPVAALVPGVLLTFVGTWMLTDGGPVALGWACAVPGLAFLLVGAVAQGVSWGMALHAETRR